MGLSVADDRVAADETDFVDDFLLAGLSLLDEVFLGRVDEESVVRLHDFVLEVPFEVETIPHFDGRFTLLHRVKLFDGFALLVVAWS